jgi:NADH/NAD ratio-sensing transcriptional regulator Rex
MKIVVDEAVTRVYTYNQWITINQEEQMEKRIPTAEMAKRFGVQSDTLRRNLCKSGHFLGVKPIKMPNGRLLWPDVWPETIVKQE